MKTKVKVFSWNEIKNRSDIKVGYFDNSKLVTSKDIEIKRILKDKLKEELV